MIIEIRKAGFVNKGAQLMQHAIHERLKCSYPEAVFTMAPSPANRSQSFRKLVDAGFYPKAWLYWGGIQWGGLAGLLPRKLREMYGLILDRDVNVVIDAAGFSYSDHWGTSGTRELANSARRWASQGTKVILMPQAFGPFRGRRIRKFIAQAVEHADLVMVRDRESYRFLTSVVGERPNVRLRGDFTNLVAGVVPAEFNPEEHRVCLVPNHRMIDSAKKSESDLYLPFMHKCARYLVERRARPFIVVHGGKEDQWLAESISAAAGGLPILALEDPVEIKGILGASHASIGSRFHGLVSALSEGVPSLATGWSHKYEELFRDYDFAEGVLPMSGQGEQWRKLIDRLVDQGTNNELRARLLERSRTMKKQSERMWEEVLEILRS